MFVCSFVCLFVCRAFVCSVVGFCVRFSLVRNYVFFVCFRASVCMCVFACCCSLVRLFAIVCVCVFDGSIVCLLVGLFVGLFGWVLVLLFIALERLSFRLVFFDVSVIFPFCRCLPSFISCLLARSSLICSVVSVRVLV